MENNSINRSVVSSSKGPSSDKSNNAGHESKQFSSSSQSVVSAPPSTTATGTSSTPAPIASKSKSVSHAYEKSDKRSTGRGNYGSNSKHSEHGGAVARPEIGSIARPGSKKAAAVCDFVEFVYDKRGGARDFHGGRFASSRAENYSRYQNYGPRNRHVSASHGPSYNKEQFLQATCQFVVMEGFNYSAHLADADLIVDWDRIEELRLTLDEIPSCPICLYPATAAKITRCGHVFCWPCILHYLALSDKTWRKCPICYESIYKNQLKSVIAAKVPHLQIGGELAMVLMRREKGANVVLPITESVNHRVQITRIDGSNTQFSKLLSITRGQVVQYIVERERVELMFKLAEDEHEPEACFIHEALESLQERELSLKAEICKTEKHSISGSPPKENPHSPFARHAEDLNFTDPFNDEKRSGGSCSVKSAQSAPAAVTNSSRRSVSAKSGGSIDDGFPEEHDASGHGIESLAAATAAMSTMNDRAYHFYQAQDGQQVYLHPLNARCFIYQYGSLSTSPETIVGEIVDIESYVMTEDLRRRFRYLAHLPLTTTFALVELKMPRNILSDATMEHFAADLAKREELRQRRAKEEKRQQVQAERWERAVMLDPRNASKYVKSNFDDPPDIPITTYVPSAQRDIEAALSVESNPDPNTATGPGSSPPPTASGEAQSSTPSFAQMLRQGKPKPAPQQTASSNRATANSELAELDEGQREFLRVHTFQDSFNDALQAALDNYNRSSNATASTDVTEEADEGTATVATKKKKKKAKGRLLFATGAAAPGMH